MFEEMHERWKECEHWDVNTACPGLDVVLLLSNGSRHIVHKFLDETGAAHSASSTISDI